VKSRKSRKSEKSRYFRWFYPMVPIILIFAVDPYVEKPLEARWLLVISSLVQSLILFAIVQPWKGK
jgi:hypothetical protein